MSRARTRSRRLPARSRPFAALAALGVAQACVSNSGRAVVDANLDALGIRQTIAFSISLDDVSAGKPDPEPYREAARRFALPAAAVVAVEDSARGRPFGARGGALCGRLSPPERKAFVGFDRSMRPAVSRVIPKPYQRIASLLTGSKKCSRSRSSATPTG